jgi:hypothetical protein
MMINPFIKKALSEISKDAIKYANTRDGEKRYLRRMLHIYENRLTEEEKLFIFKYLLELIHHRNIITDPDNILTIYNIKFRNFFVMFAIVFTAFILALLFLFSPMSIAGTIQYFVKVFSMLNI